jgi:hypothetical protein
MIDYTLNAYSGTGHFTGCEVKFFCSGIVGCTNFKTTVLKVYGSAPWTAECSNFRIAH